VDKGGSWMKHYCGSIWFDGYKNKIIEQVGHSNYILYVDYCGIIKIYHRKQKASTPGGFFLSFPHKVNLRSINKEYLNSEKALTQWFKQTTEIYHVSENNFRLNFPNLNFDLMVSRMLYNC